MDYFESLEFHSTNQKSHRMRSWYLYEQFKSLEKNQLDAVEQLRNKTFQDHVLHRELSERRARRSLCDQFGRCQSESGLQSVRSDAQTCVSVSHDDFFESFSELQDDEDRSRATEPMADSDTMSQDDSQSQVLGACGEDCKSLRDLKVDDNRDVSDFVSIENLTYTPNILHDNLVDDITQELEFAKKNIAENINLQLETVKGNYQCLEELTKLREYEQCSLKCDEDSMYDEHCYALDELKGGDIENNLIAMWTKIVSFAYQVVKLNHGNCYYDYSSQFLTAVLACDVLRRGVCMMCDILQPFISPVKFETEDYDTSAVSHKSLKSMKCDMSKKIKRCSLNKFLSRRKTKKWSKSCRCDRLYQNPNSSKFSCAHKMYTSDNNFTETVKLCNKCIASEPWNSVAKFCEKQFSDKSFRSVWTEDFVSEKPALCSCHTVTNPMLKLVGYIDEMMQDASQKL